MMHNLITAVLYIAFAIGIGIGFDLFTEKQEDKIYGKEQD